MRKKAKRIQFVKDFPFPEQITSKPRKINSIIQLEGFQKTPQRSIEKNGNSVSCSIFDKPHQLRKP